MPLLDHFRPPLHPQHHWEWFHSNWATRIADVLNDQWLPPEYLAEESTHAGARVEIDVATFEQSAKEVMPAEGDNAGAVATVRPRAWAPPAPAHSVPCVLTEGFEVLVFSTVAGMKLVGAIEIVSPGKKDRFEERRAFAIKCASYLHQGISLVLVDIVTNRRANLHNQVLELLDADEKVHLPGEVNLYAAAYRPVARGGQTEVDLWSSPFEIGEALPVMPLWLRSDLTVPVDFDATYQEACRRRRLA